MRNFASPTVNELLSTCLFSGLNQKISSGSFLKKTLFNFAYSQWVLHKVFNFQIKISKCEVFGSDCLFRYTLGFIAPFSPSVWRASFHLPLRLLKIRKNMVHLCSWIEITIFVVNHAQSRLGSLLKYNCNIKSWYKFTIDVEILHQYHHLINSTYRIPFFDNHYFS